MSILFFRTKKEIEMTRTSDYITGIGRVKGSLKKKIYYEKFLDRNIISEKEYIRFRKIYARLRLKENQILHKKSVVEKILRKYNTPACGRIAPI